MSDFTNQPNLTRSPFTVLDKGINNIGVNSHLIKRASAAVGVHAS